MVVFGDGGGDGLELPDGGLFEEGAKDGEFDVVEVFGATGGAAEGAGEGG